MTTHRAPTHTQMALKREKVDRQRVKQDTCTYKMNRHTTVENNQEQENIIY